MSLLVYLVLLPWAVPLLGSLLAVVDGAGPGAILRRLGWRTLPFVAAVWLFGSQALLAAAAALLTVAALHVAFSVTFRAVTRRRAQTDCPTQARDR